MHGRFSGRLGVKNMKRIAAVGAIATTLVVGGSAGAFAASTPSTAPGGSTGVTPSTCLPGGHDDSWPVWADGNPGRSAGVTVWHDSNGWHVRVTHNAIHDRVFSGEIVTKGALVDVTAVRLEKNDHLVVGTGQHSIRFRFNNYGGVDGFDFATKCAPALGFGFLSDGHVVPTGRISIGAAARHPEHDPFVIARTA